ncbi:unnamed protein product [Lactuca virosa]|uniref:Uncharacterized protein n=1 Tax=Lactuca virosa TaxID=75947 RepID=A0AAU9LE52_9ASTR|nr:unnamed protein product [Lactuca virosa]
MMAMANTRMSFSLIVSRQSTRFEGSGVHRIVPFQSYCSSNEEALGRGQSIYEKIHTCDDARKLFDNMIQSQSLPDAVKFNQLMQAVIRMKAYSCALDMFKQMTARGVKIEVYTINIAINCCCKLGKVNDGFGVLCIGLKLGIVPDRFTFSTLLDGLIRADRVREAELFFKKLIKEEVCQPDTAMYNTMIKGLCKASQNSIAIGLLRLMEERGCRPNVITYSTLIDSLFKAEKPDEALKLFKEMVFEKWIEPNVVTYSCLIHGLCMLCRWDEVYKLMKEMEEYRISPTVETYNILVDNLCREGMTKDAEVVVGMMDKRGIYPNVVTYSSIIDGYCMLGEVRKAMEVFHSMVSRDLAPDVVTYNTLLDGHCKHLTIEDGMHLFNEMTKKGVHPDEVTYNIIIHGMFKAGHCEYADKFFKDMIAKGFSLGLATYRIMLKGLCDNNQVDKALDMSLLMGKSRSDLGSDIHAYNILIDGSSKSGNFDKARDLFKEITLKGLQPDVQSYNVMIRAFLRKDLVMDAKQLFLEMEGNGIKPNEVTYNTMIQGYLWNKVYDDIQLLVNEMHINHFSLDASTCTQLIDKINDGSLPTALWEKFRPNESVEDLFPLEKMMSSISSLSPNVEK